MSQGCETQIFQGGSLPFYLLIHPSGPRDVFEIAQQLTIGEESLLDI